MNASGIHDPLVLKKKGDESFREGDYLAAIEYYTQAIELDPNYIDAWNNLGSALNKIGKTSEAMKCDLQVKKIKRLKERKGIRDKKESENNEKSGILERIRGFF